MRTVRSPDARASEAVALTYAWCTERLHGSLVSTTEPGIRLCTEDGTRDVGTEPLTDVRASRFELVRAMTGRRSAAQIEAYEWHGPARPEALLLSIFTLRVDDLAE